MRPPVGLPTMSKRAKRVLIALVSLAVLAILWFQFVGIYVDWLWYGEVGYRAVFTTQAVSRIIMFLIGGIGSAALVFLAMYMAYRPRPVFVPSGESDPLAPYRTIVTSRPKLFVFGVAGLVGLICGLSAQSDWTTVQLWLHGGDFGTVDPQFGNDVGFYVFTLPMIQLILGWLFVIIALCFVLVAVVQYLFGGIRLSGPGRKVTPQATMQLSLLVAAFGLLVLSSVLIGGVWPLVLQQVVVNPNGINREPEYISRNIDATRTAYKIRDDQINYVDYAGQLTGDPSAIISDQDTVPNARLLDPNVLSPTFTQQQQLRNFYGFPDQLAVDRYTVGGKTQDYVVAVRELNADGLNDAQKNWINEHMVFTHGDGFVAAPANTVSNGYPDFTNGVSDIANIGNPNSKIPVSQPRTYYGQLTTDYAIVGAEGGVAGEYATETTRYTYTGAGGVPIGNLFQRAVFATEYGEANFLFSSEINANSKIMYNRDPLTRVQKAAPFLTTDTKAYPAVVDGRIVWIVDAYTTATNYPYAQAVTLSDATNNSLAARTGAGQVDRQVSYIRNSVKATVDAYDGTVTLYAVDEKDPVLKAWEGVFPGLMKSNADVSDSLRSHFRYPQDLFEVQRSLLVRYHVDDPVDFFQSSGFWRVPNDPTVSDSSVQAAQPPYYLQVKLPGSSKATFQLTSVLTGFQRDFMSAYVSADSDPADYGKLTVLRLPTATQTPGPIQVQQLFRTTQQISSLVTLSQQQNGSRVIFGNLLTLPVNNGLLYVEPFYIQGQASSSSSFPQLNQVLVWYAGHVGVGTTLTQALTRAAQSAPVQTPSNDGSGGVATSGTDTATPTTTAPSSTAAPPADQAAALAQMDSAASALDDAKSSGDLGQIGAASQKLEDAVKAYLALAGTSIPSASLGPVPSS